MADQLDLLLLATVKDPELRASIERLGNIMAEAPPAPAPVPEPTSGAKIIPFPFTPEATRPISNDMARSALFSCVQGKNRRMLKNATVATVGDVKIEFSGEQWNQDDHDVLMQLVFMAHDKPFGQVVSVSSYAVLAGLGRMQGGRQHEHLRQEIERLTKGSVTLRSKEVNYTGHFIEESLQDLQTRQWLYRFNVNMQVFFGLDNYTLIDWERRKSLKRKDLARWLQLYWSTHSKPFPVSIEYLRHKSGSQTAELWEFRRMLKHALKVLDDNGDIEEWKIEQPGDLVYVDRGKATSKAQVRHLSRKQKNTAK